MQILGINSTHAHFVFINKTVHHVRLNSDAEKLLIPTAISPIQNQVQKQQSMQKYLELYMRKESETKYQDNYQRILEDAILEIWAGFLSIL